MTFLIAALLMSASIPSAAVRAAAVKYQPRYAWSQGSVVAGNFTCRGEKEYAILAVTASDLVVAVFVRGVEHAPKLISIPANVGNPKARLAAEDLDFDAEADLGYALPGFHRSKTCQGLSVDDGETDPAHIYWDRGAGAFRWWSL